MLHYYTDIAFSSIQNKYFFFFCVYANSSSKTILKIHLIAKNIKQQCYVE